MTALQKVQQRKVRKHVLILFLRSHPSLLLGVFYHLKCLGRLFAVMGLSAEGGLYSKPCLFWVLFFVGAARPFSVDVLSFDDLFDASVVVGLGVAGAFVVFVEFVAGGAVGLGVFWAFEVSPEVELGEEGLVGLFEFLDVGLGVFEEIKFFLFQFFYLHFEGFSVEFELLFYLSK